MINSEPTKSSTFELFLKAMLEARLSQSQNQVCTLLMLHTLAVNMTMCDLTVKECLESTRLRSDDFYKAVKELIEKQLIVAFDIVGTEIPYQLFEVDKDYSFQGKWHVLRIPDHLMGSCVIGGLD